MRELNVIFVTKPAICKIHAIPAGKVDLMSFGFVTAQTFVRITFSIRYLGGEYLSS